MLKLVKAAGLETVKDTKETALYALTVTLIVAIFNFGINLWVMKD